VARAGYTLIELMVVLAILAILTAVALPALRRPLEKSRVKDGAQQVTKSLAGLRVAAMQEGRAYLFRYQLGGTRFQTCPAELFFSAPDLLTADVDEQTTLETMDSASTDSGAAGSMDGSLDADQADGSQVAQADVVEIQGLPEGIRFSDAVVDDVESRLDEQAVRDRQLVEVPVPEDESVGQLADDAAPWSSPVLFYPDGRATSVMLTLISDQGYEIDVELRGLTGAVRMRDLRRTAGTLEGALEGATWEDDIPEQPIP
jgi:prepilin-type N-terminal cleavage/methylation domain-containing protein